MDHFHRSCCVVLEETVKAMFRFRAFLVWCITIGVETVHGILHATVIVIVPVLGDFSASEV